MTIQEAYEQLAAILPSDTSITIQCDVWWHSWRNKRREPSLTFMVSWSGGAIHNGQTLEDAVTLALIAAREANNDLAEAETFTVEAVAATQ